ncbi:hypothetical protein [Glycomyces buryatensis]|uniref:PEGA domain-containing protein n=1 Tax=Glycomyces buryatensis TaxID=2570927 RepID=A0A4S8QG68_9ACTN|nr:hypothetical protein [Glycomyces buryatensis]THV42701.1 hypothetical protein FAB82_04765 [Glycomyces buryatensis]
MDLTAGLSPVFKAPWAGWKLTELGERRASADAGKLSLRVGYCGITDSLRDSWGVEKSSARERAGDPIESKGDLRSSLVPVVVVDGEPVATGWGSLDLPLTPGRHLVEVQSQHSRAWRAVDIRSGRTAKLDYIGLLGDQHRSYATGQVRGGFAHLSGYTLGPRGRLDFWQYLAANVRGRRVTRRFVPAAFCIVFVCGPLMAAGAIESEWIRTNIGIIALAAVAALFMLWALRIVWTSLRYNRLEPEEPLDPRPFTHSGWVPLLVLDPSGPAPEPEPGRAAILIDARFIKTDLTSADLTRQFPAGKKVLYSWNCRQLDKVGEIVPVRHRFAVPPPEILLDGQALPASWTRIWLQLEPGRHRLEVRSPQSPLPVPTGEAAADSESFEFTAEEGGTVGIDATVEIKAVPDPTEPVLHEWRSSVARLQTGPTDPERGPAPNLDIAGDLVHMITKSPQMRYREGPSWTDPGSQGNRFR